MDSYIGEIAALLAAAGFTVTSVCYTFAGRRVNAVGTIALSLPVSWLIIMALHGLTLGEPLPFRAAPDRWLFLSISGILAFVVAAYFMLNAYQRIGPRLTMLIMSFAPVLGALLAWLLQGQTLALRTILGIGMVISGIVWVVAERSKNGTRQPGGDVRRGIINACLATLAQAFSFVFASQGVSGGFPPLSATLIRITAGMVVLWAFVAAQRNVRATAGIALRDWRLSLLLVGAAVTGQVIAGWLLLVAFQYIPVGVATTLSHTTAIMLIPVGAVVFRERITLRAVAGTLMTIAGIAILFVG